MTSAIRPSGVVLLRFHNEYAKCPTPMLSVLIVAVLCTVAAGLLVLTRPRSLQGSTTHILKLRSPNQISAGDIALLVLQAILKHIPGYSPSLTPGRARTQTFQLPAIRTEGVLRINDENVASFREALKTQQSDDGSKINPFFLVASTVPLTIFILTHRSCPIKPLGAVNIHNHLRFLDPEFCRSVNAMRAAADASELSYGASFGGEDSPGRRSKRGIEFCISISLFTPRAVVLQLECWYLQPLAKSVEPKWVAEGDQAAKHADTGPEDMSKVEQASFKMVPEDPLLWAATSKDYNPIHVSNFGAKLFGFENVIAHGNHVGALAVEQLRTKSGEAYRMCWESKDAFSIAMKFTRPMTLPAVADTEWHTNQLSPGAEFVVKRNGKACIEGSVSSG